MTLAQTILAMGDAGCSREQVLAVVAAHEAERAARAEARRLAQFEAINAVAYDAIEAALFEPTKADIAGKPDSAPQSPLLESAFVDAARTVAPQPPGDVRSVPIKSAARAGLLASGLTPCAQAVAARLVEHRNMQTGRCDPSVGTLAAATGFVARSVRRALRQLEADGLIASDIHAGRGHSNGYRLDLDRMAAFHVPLVAVAEKRTLETVKEDSRVLQNRGMKQSLRMPRARGSPLSSGQLELPVMSVVRRSNLSDEQHATARLYRDLRRELGDGFGAMVERLSADEALHDRAIAAEARTAGSGVFVVMTGLVAKVGATG